MDLADQTSDQVRTIATASEEQSASSEQISRGIEEVTQIASETTQDMRRSSNAVDQLARQAGQLKTLITAMNRSQA
ncbi:methyl-accepting chemotaxis protein (MCP) [Desulfocurvibacter africanus PCS]|uniref:Methyl-accepting chemotaxis protein (MCP) n=1 Tax=Desulfocurvibacter africanus PCS TaxID=1262666 RepID=M5Q1N2_DESAF|nr:methyl-accepting chemotaxis protein (MCP) [Desulfocurvibacter africanus]EMG37721.1 methyl-accepting chemotaxis protein (MCP) [Desulfocurvibacter africanus PCS]